MEDHSTTTIVEVPETEETDSGTNEVPNGVVPAYAKEVSAVTIGKLMGLVTANDFALLQSKVDLLTTKLTVVSARLEKLLGVLQRSPTGSDLERIDVQIAALRSLIVDTLAGVDPNKTKPTEPPK